LHLESKQNNGASSNLGKITFAGKLCGVPVDFFKPSGTYQAQFSAAPAGYAFDHWETTTGITVSNSYGNPTTVTVSSSGTLRAVYTAAPLFADGFESGSFSAWTSTSYTGGETATVVKTLEHHGMYGAKFTSDGTSGTENSYCSKTIASSSEVYSRGYFYVSQSGIADAGDKFSFMLLLNGSQTVASAGWTKSGGIVKWFLTIRNGTTYVSTYSTTSTSLNQWYCVELHWKKSATAGLGELFVNGAKVCTLTGKNTTAYGNVIRARFGLPNISNCAATTAYGDCAKIARFYIGPEPALFSFADGFESGSFSAWTGTGVTSGETASAVNAQAHHGTYSAMFTSNGNGGTEAAYCIKTVTSSAELYARGYFKVAKASSTFDQAYLISIKAGSAFVAYAGLRVQNGVVKWNLQVREGTGWANAYAPVNVTALSGWLNFELYWKGDVTNGQGALYVGGTKVCSLTGKNTAVFGNANSVSFGLPEIVKCGALAVYCDCVRIANTYISPES
jgi:hypothetical protein